MRKATFNFITSFETLTHTARPLVQRTITNITALSIVFELLLPFTLLLLVTFCESSF
jgi:hypothetical protein